MEEKHYHVSLSVQPSRGLTDERVTVLVHKARPGSQLTIRSIHQCDGGNSWEAYGHYTANSNGTVNVAEDLSLGGTYSGVEPMGLLWSLRPTPGCDPLSRMRKLNVQTPMEVTVSVYQGHLTEGFKDMLPLATVMLERWYMAPGIRRIPITDAGLTATLFLPLGPGPFPAVLDLWGGAGKLVEYRSALFASHGFASLTLDYLTNKTTLETGKFVDDKYFEAAYRVLEQHPQVHGGRIGMVGLSLGCSFTLKMAIYSNIFKLRCAVCISGCHVQPVDGSVERIMDFFKENSSKARLNKENQLIFRGLQLPIPTDTSSKLDVGRIQCPLLLVVGEDDQNLPACESAADIKEMMERAGKRHLLTVLSYPDAGHLIEPPFTPHTRIGKCISVTQEREKLIALWGGEMVAHAHAQEDAWRKLLLFLRENLMEGAGDESEAN